MIGFKIDNCPEKMNRRYFNEIFYIGRDTAMEVGLECYEKERSCDLDSELIKDIFEEFSNRDTPNIVHMSLKTKLLNKTEFTEEDWLKEWRDQFSKINNENIDYVILHATSKESPELSEEDQIEIICNNFLKLEKISNFPIFIENTYEDLPFYKALFKKAPKSMNFVLDIGHKKIHSTSSNKEWIDFLIDLKKEGRRLHFHIHDNSGISDQHKPLHFYKGERALIFFKQLNKEFNSSNFIIEIHGSDIHETLREYVYLNEALSK